VFGSFGISGLLTGVITESIIDKNQARIEEQRQEREAKHRLLEEQAGVLYDEMLEEKEVEMDDDECEVCLSIEDLVYHREHIEHLFQAAGVAFPTYDFEGMCAAMDFDDSGTIAKGEFVHGILELCEDVRPMSIMELHSHVSKVKSKVNAIHSDVEELNYHVNPGFRRRSSKMPDSDPDFSALTRCSSRKTTAQGSRDQERDAETSKRLDHQEALLGKLKQMVEGLMEETQVTIQAKAARSAGNVESRFPDQQHSAGSVFSPGQQQAKLPSP